MVDVLFVCHANMCRSPMAEFIARRLLRDLPVAVASAGTDALDGAAMHPYAVEVAAGTGADPAACTNRPQPPDHHTPAGPVQTPPPPQPA
ncbi:arsenate reductase/protein-tyrosine-phosphatase family protein, partial [Micromonospora chersina]